MALAQAVGNKWRPPTLEAIFVRQGASTGGNVRPVLHDSENARWSRAATRCRIVLKRGD